MDATGLPSIQHAHGAWDLRFRRHQSSLYGTLPLWILRSTPISNTDPKA